MDVPVSRGVLSQAIKEKCSSDHREKLIVI
jgi:hypothetical protein